MSFDVPTAANHALDPVALLLSDHGMGNFDDPGPSEVEVEELAGRFDFATYRDAFLNYTIRYDKRTGNSSAIMLEPVQGQDECGGNDLRRFRPLQNILRRPSPLCLGIATFSDFFPSDGSSLRYPEADIGFPALCSGEASAGGHSGRDTLITISCHRIRYSLADPELQYAIEIGAAGVPVQRDANFKLGIEPDVRALEEFLTGVADMPVQYVVMFRLTGPP